MITWSGAWSVIKLLWFVFWGNRRYTIPALLIAAVGLFGFCAYRDSQKEVQREREARSAESQMRVDEAKADANEAGNIANQSENEAKEQRNANINSFGNNYDEARRKYCEKFPKDCL